MNIAWPWGNYWQDPDWDALKGQPQHVEVTPDEPIDEPHIFGPDGEPLPTRPAVPIGFQIPSKDDQ